MQKTLKKTQKGFTLIELLIVIAVIAILAAIAIPNLLASRKAANESSAISSLRTIVSAEETYRSRVNPPAYTDLATLAGDPWNLIPDSLTAATGKSGYAFAAVGSADGTTYTVTAAPVTLGTTGDRYFFVDQTGVIRADTAAIADATGGTPIE